MMDELVDLTSSCTILNGGKVITTTMSIDEIYRNNCMYASLDGCIKYNKQVVPIIFGLLINLPFFLAVNNLLYLIFYNWASLIDVLKLKPVL